MRAILQRVSRASVTIDGVVHGEIEKGFLILLGVHETDTTAEADVLIDKCAGLRVFEDEDEKMNLSLADVGGAVLAVSNFTLYGDCRRGKRPSFSAAARPETANPLYEYFVEGIRAKGIRVETGVFGADMKVELLNDGPVTIFLDTDELARPRR
ncbi:MAG: D-tyrosyl-tRNA(Tyr) deacylase [Clostridia bacterium]|nr:D-tyrosyl-tRNA(Tyr) deacylase [Clostridia bacterium]